MRERNSPVNIRLDTSLDAYYRSIAAQLDVPFSELIREAIERLSPEWEARAKAAAAKGKPVDEDDVSDELNALGREIVAKQPISVTHEQLRGPRGRAMWYLLASIWLEPIELTPIQKRRIRKALGQ